MSTRFNLQNLLDLAQSRTDAATRNLGQAFSREHSEQQKLQMLIEYRRDYQASFQQALKGGVSPASWRNYQEFMDKLDLAVKQQAEMVAHWQHQAASSRQAWESERRQLKSYDTLSQRHAQAQVRRENLAEQKQQDEYCAANSARSMAND